MTEPLPCWDCGGEPKETYWRGGEAYANGRCYRIECKDGCRPSTGHSESREIAITAWNVRTPVVITDAMVEAGAVAAAKVIAARHGHEFEFWLNDERRTESRAVLSAFMLNAKEPNL